jgi:hypothetical protein
MIYLKWTFVTTKIENDVAFWWDQLQREGGRKTSYFFLVTFTNILVTLKLFEGRSGAYIIKLITAVIYGFRNNLVFVPKH